MPPPLPRSSTTSPGESEARAVGLPQPSEAFTASSGSSSTSSPEYRFEVIGEPLEPQHDPASLTRRARSAYLVRTASRRLSELTSVIGRSSIDRRISIPVTKKGAAQAVVTL